MKRVLLLIVGLLSICSAEVYRNSLQNKDYVHSPMSINNKDETGCKNLLHPFYISYAEWKTIRCIIATDKIQYWDKAMIGLIEKSGKLRISFQNRNMYLYPVKNYEIKEGDWSNVYKNDSLEIQFSAHFDNKEILRCFTGNGIIRLQYKKQVYQDSAYFVHNNE